MTNEYCINECKRILQIVDSYRCGFESIYNAIRQSVVHTQYGYGGECMHRGFYCPSLICDIIMGNVNRGCVSNAARNTKADYEFGFDNGNRLVTVVDCNSKEIIFHMHLKSLGVCLSGAGTYIISECDYNDNDQLVCYTQYMHPGYIQEITEFTREIYRYEKNSLIVDWYRFRCHKRKQPILEHFRYIFALENEMLSSYTIEEYSRENRVSSAWDEHVFVVPKKKRRIVSGSGDVEHRTGNGSLPRE